MPSAERVVLCYGDSNTYGSVPGEPGGRVFCYLSESTGHAFVVWTSVAGMKLLLSAELDSLRHRDLYFWWASIRHEFV